MYFVLTADGASFAELVFVDMRETTDRKIRETEIFHDYTTHGAPIPKQPIERQKKFTAKSSILKKLNMCRGTGLKLCLFKAKIQFVINLQICIPSISSSKYIFMQQATFSRDGADLSLNSDWSNAVRHCMGTVPHLRPNICETCPSSLADILLRMVMFVRVYLQERMVTGEI